MAESDKALGKPNDLDIVVSKLAELSQPPSEHVQYEVIQHDGKTTIKITHSELLKGNEKQPGFVTTELRYGQNKQLSEIAVRTSGENAEIIDPAYTQEELEENWQWSQSHKDEPPGEPLDPEIYKQVNYPLSPQVGLLPMTEYKREEPGKFSMDIYYQPIARKGQLSPATSVTEAFGHMNIPLDFTSRGDTSSITPETVPALLRVGP